MSAPISSTIAAIATPGGYGGVGIVRLSGPKALSIAKKICAKPPRSRYATYTDFLSEDKSIIDSGIALYFKGPYSFTGEDVLELQAHGGPVILNILLNRVMELGAEHAKPGEFSERAFLNDKIDLLQAEAIADLIAANSEAAARAAQRSLQGQFSEKINQLNEKIIYLRTYVEASIDFPEEEIDFLSDGYVKDQLAEIIKQCEEILSCAKEGVVLQEGIHIVLAGEPNAGKSSLLNALAQKDSAIVTDIPGTTRDILREKIHLEGVTLHLSDTAGLRKTLDIIEQEGIKRANQEIEKADIVLWVVDSQKQQHDFSWLNEIPKEKLIIVFNKIDVSPVEMKDKEVSYISAKTGAGFDSLKQKIFKKIGIEQISSNQISARQRHLDALLQTLSVLKQGQEVLDALKAGELLAEHLRQAHQKLGEITGVFTVDDLLGEIFSKFCIGK